MWVSRALRPLVALAALALSFASIDASRAADAKTVAAIVAKGGADRVAFLEAGAREEGSLLVYTVGAQIDPLLAAFHARHPFLDVRAYKADTVAVTRRMTRNIPPACSNAARRARR